MQLKMKGKITAINLDGEGNLVLTVDLDQRSVDEHSKDAVRYTRSGAGRASQQRTTSSDREWGADG